MTPEQNTMATVTSTSKPVKKFTGPHAYLIWPVLFFIVALTIRIGFYVETLSTPVDYAHEWRESDMNFFDHWATQIAKGDWFNEKAPD